MADRYVHTVRTDDGLLSLMLAGDTIVAYKEDDLFVHHVDEHAPESLPSGPDGADITCGFAALVEQELVLVVGRVSHPTDIVIGFYDQLWCDASSWGYAWHVDHPGRSHWARGNDIAAAMVAEDRPVGSNLEVLVRLICRLCWATRRVHPRAAALATCRAEIDLDAFAADFPDLVRWLETYGDALEACREMPEDD